MKTSTFEFIQYVLIRAGFLAFITILLDVLLGGLNGTHSILSLILWIAILIEMVVFYCLGHTRRCLVPDILIVYDEFHPLRYITSTLLAGLISFAFIVIHVTNVLNMLVPSLVLLIIGIILSLNYINSKGGMMKRLHPHAASGYFREYPVLIYTQYVILRIGLLTFTIILLDNILSLTIVGKHSGILFAVWAIFLIGMIVYYYNVKSEYYDLPHILIDYDECPVWYYIFSTFLVAVISFTIMFLHFSGIAGMFILSIVILVVGIILWLIYNSKRMF